MRLRYAGFARVARLVDAFAGRMRQRQRDLDDGTGVFAADDLKRAAEAQQDQRYRGQADATAVRPRLLRRVANLLHIAQRHARDRCRPASTAVARTAHPGSALRRRVAAAGAPSRSAAHRPMASPRRRYKRGSAGSDRDRPAARKRGSRPSRASFRHARLGPTNRLDDIAVARRSRRGRRSARPAASSSVDDEQLIRHRETRIRAAGRAPSTSRFSDFGMSASAE